MRKVNLEPYEVDLEPGTSVPYDVKRSLVNLLFGPHNSLDAEALLSRDDLARKIRAAQESVLLEDAEYRILEAAVRGFRGYGEHDVELVRRVLGAPAVEVEERK